MSIRCRLLLMVSPKALEALHQKLSHKQRFRRQRGTVVERTDGFYIRYYKDGDGGRTKVTERLCDLGIAQAKVKLLRDSHMSAVNNTRHTELHSATPAPVLTVGAFWKETYLPWVQANKRFSTARGYQTVWKLYVKPELETTPINTFTTVQACELLDRMVTVKKLNENTLASVKSLCRGIFTTACRKGIITINPWREAKESVSLSRRHAFAAHSPMIAQAMLWRQQDSRSGVNPCAMYALRPTVITTLLKRRKPSSIEACITLVMSFENATRGELAMRSTSVENAASGRIRLHNSIREVSVPAIRFSAFSATAGNGGTSSGRQA